MKRTLAIGAVAVMLLALGWSLFWWFGRGEVRRTVDASLARLERQGWDIDWDEREIGGFPFGYTVRLTGVTVTDTGGGATPGAGEGSGQASDRPAGPGSNGRLTLRLPWAVARTDGTQRVIVRMPETFALDMPFPAIATAAGAAADAAAETAAGTAAEAGAGTGTEPGSGPAADAPDAAANAPAAADGAREPAMLAATGQADSLLLVLSADGAVGATADRLQWTIEDPSGGGTVTQSVEALEAAATPGAQGARYRVQAARLGAEASLPESGGEPSTAIASLRGVVVEGTSALGSSSAFAQMLYAGGPGSAEGALTAGAAEVRMVSAGGTPGMIDWRAEAMSGTAVLSSGRMELQGETRGNVWNLTSPDPALPIQGQLSVASAKASYAMPMAPSERPDEMAIRLSLQDATADERVWALIDPQGVLPRAPASLLVDLTGTARVTERIDRLRPGAPPPYEISSLDFNEVSIRALGAGVTASGALEILQPLALPLGELEVGFTGIAELVRVLGRAGVLAPEMVAMAEAIMEVYLRPAGGEDAWTAEIGFTREGTLVNGLPVR